jgi:endonuclease YncB( thermonuclease family)
MCDFTSRRSFASDFRKARRAIPGWLGSIALLLAATVVYADKLADCPKSPDKDLAEPPETGTLVHVVKVVDGDTLHVEYKGTRYRVRLAEIDAPERDQPYGAEATSELIGLVMDKDIGLFYVECDKYRRIVAGLLVNGELVNDAMVERGAAWFESEYSDSAALYEIENHARDAKRGLWGLPNDTRVEPRIWRKMSKEQKAEFLNI